MKHLLLWDIDGTLIASGGAGMRALQRALQKTFGIDGSLEDIEFAGRTDTWIMREVFRKFAIAATPQDFSRFFAGYLAELPAALNNPHARVLPGVREILCAVTRHGGIAQGLLTGNMIHPTTRDHATAHQIARSSAPTLLYRSTTSSTARSSIPQATCAARTISRLNPRRWPAQ